jgi:hypothetical protein
LRLAIWCMLPKSSPTWNSLFSPIPFWQFECITHLLLKVIIKQSEAAWLKNCHSKTIDSSLPKPLCSLLIWVGSVRMHHGDSIPFAQWTPPPKPEIRHFENI